jgi:hypothetical protein
MFQLIRLWQQHCKGHERNAGGKRKVWKQEGRNVKHCEVNREGEQDRENNHKNNSMLVNIEHRIISD